MMGALQFCLLLGGGAGEAGAAAGGRGGSGAGVPAGGGGGADGEGGLWGRGGEGGRGWRRRGGVAADAAAQAEETAGECLPLSLSRFDTLSPPPLLYLPLPRMPPQPFMAQPCIPQHSISLALRERGQFLGECLELEVDLLSSSFSHEVPSHRPPPMFPS